MSEQIPPAPLVEAEHLCGEWNEAHPREP